MGGGGGGGGGTSNIYCAVSFFQYSVFLLFFTGVIHRYEILTYHTQNATRILILF